ncbi:hypothetical protein SAPIO_CDS9334 [Scedosporium apiospermum]|uniref:Uncharacterized protein n=1 Tax=Pseudallescheria apiosperma TaxID=563466 RepID=A0A084FWK7_PSEDA|nr:uncharacterized protein SAPIO_CDS9334 [Scedosporium apiospermum]KEZ39469.1 hypothetical protein SAPIO_CDS9334 [Scedosporium apiospermum]
MFVLPPPPRYPSQASYGLANAGLFPLIETNNILTNPTGPEYQFLVGEGTYVLKEDLLLATPPAHPSEIPNANPNPLATTPQPATSGCRPTLVSLDVRHAPRFFLGSSNTTLSLNGAPESIQEHPNESRYSNELGALSSDEGRGTSTSDAPPTTVTLGSSTPAFGEGNALLTPNVNPKDANKKRKPKSNMSKSNSSFISRVIGNDMLSKRLQDRPSDGIFAFANVNRSFQWLDLSSPTKGVINATPVSEIKWIPGSENLFLAAHMDGSLIVYDKEKEDAAFNASEESASSSGEVAAQPSSGKRVNYSKQIEVNKSVYSKNQKSNPVALWKVSNQRINAFAFSPDNRHLAVVSEDGTLRIIDYLKERLLDLFYSYYGGLTCVCWSPDGKYVLTGGQDDLISIWSVAESAIVARCQGHQSWVTAVAFDPWRCDDRNYRFGSVGEDCRLCLWDFNVGMIHRPKAVSVLHRASISSKLTNPQQRLETTNTKSSNRGRAGSNASADGEEDISESVSHPVEPRSRTAMLPPVSTQVVDTHPIAWLEFTEDSVMTSCKSGKQN